MTDIRRVWADAIRLERHRQRLDQEEVAQLAGLHQTTVSKAELGRGDIQTYEAIAAALNVDLLGVAS